MCGAPIVHGMLINAPGRCGRHRPRKVSRPHRRRGAAGGRDRGMERIGFDITHVYGLTEVYGPASVCAKHRNGTRCRRRRARASSTAARACAILLRRPSRGRPGDACAGAARRRDDGRDHVPRQHRHEGLSEEPEGHAEAFAGGWFHSGDLAVMQPDGYVKIKDRSKDIIISGGENISSHRGRGRPLPPSRVLPPPSSRARREVGRDALRLRRTEGRRHATTEEISPTARAHLPGFKVPKHVVFGRCRRPRPARSRSSCCASRPTTPFSE
jgi:fatty-acyl-CoA synthase